MSGMGNEYLGDGMNGSGASGLAGANADISTGGVVGATVGSSTGADANVDGSSDNTDSIADILAGDALQDVLKNLSIGVLDAISLGDLAGSLAANQTDGLFIDSEEKAENAPSVAENDGLCEDASMDPSKISVENPLVEDKDIQTDGLFIEAVEAADQGAASADETDVRVTDDTSDVDALGANNAGEADVRVTDDTSEADALGANNAGEADVRVTDDTSEADALGANNAGEADVRVTGVNRAASTGGRLERARAARKLLRRGAQSIEDDALDALGADSFFDAWRKGASYAAGEIVSYQGQLYRIILAHKGRAQWAPDVSPTLFHPLRAISASPDVIDDTPDWVKPKGAKEGYNTGALVRYQGAIWRSAVNFNTHAPGDVAGQWVLKGN